METEAPRDEVTSLNSQSQQGTQARFKSRSDFKSLLPLFSFSAMQVLLSDSSRNFWVSLPPNGQRRFTFYYTKCNIFQPISEIVLSPTDIGVWFTILLTRALDSVFLKVSDPSFYRLRKGLQKLPPLDRTPGTGSQSLHVMNKEPDCSEGRWTQTWWEVQHGSIFLRAEWKRYFCFTS